MNPRREFLSVGLMAGTVLFGRDALAAGACADGSSAAGSALLDRYVAAINAHDTSSFGEIHAENYIQNSGRSPSGLAAQVENFRGIFARMPDVRARVEDRIVAGDRVVARMSLEATHTQPLQGIPPTGR